MNQVVKFRDVEEGAPERVVLGEQALDQLFRAARTHNGWQKRPVPRQLLQQAVELAKMGPTAANSSPLRIVFVESPEAKERLKAALNPGNVEKTLAAPVTAIMANDQAFYEHYPRLFPHADARSWFAGNEVFIAHTAMQSGTLQAAYFILALRAVGLDAGPMNGFDNAKVDQDFFAGTTFRSNILINIGYGDPEKLFPRSPRLECPEIAQFA